MRLTGIPSIILFLTFAPFSTSGGALAESNDDFPQFLIDPLEFPPSFQTPDGTFLLSDTDFIYCAGKNFQEPPPSTPPFMNGRSAGVMNNEALNRLFENEGSAPTLRESVEVFKKAYDEDPLFFPFVYNLGRLLALDGKREEAIYYFARSAELIPEFYGSFQNIGRLYLRLGKKMEGVTSLKLAARKNPRRIEPLIELAREAASGGLYSRALNYLDEADAIRPNHPSITEVRAELMERSGNAGEARRLYESILFESDIGEEIQYDHSIYHRRGAYYERLGEYGTALRDYSKLLEFKGSLFLYGINPQSVVRRIIALEKRSTPPER